MNLLWRFFWFLLTWRKRAPLGFFDEAETPFRVWPTDLDPNWHMNNGVYLSLMDLGRFDLVFRSGFAAALKRERWYPVVASQTIRYRRSLAPFQKFSIRTRLMGWDERFFFIQQKFMLGEEVAALAVVKGRFLKKSGGGVTPSETARIMGQSEVSPQLPEWITKWTEAEDASWKASVG